MKVVLLAGGFGTRISEESQFIPKPMIEIGGMPILWHIMKEYSHYGFHDFVICAGYKQHVIKEFFANYYLRRSDITFDFSAKNIMQIHNNMAEPWRITIVDTGLNTMTGGRIKRIQPYVEDQTFLMTYGDGLCDVNINDLVAFHKEKGKIATLTAVRPEGRFGNLNINQSLTVERFAEKNEPDDGWINGGYMVLDPAVFDYIDGDETMFERAPLERLASEGQLVAYKYNGFWKCMDTMNDKMYLEKLLAQGQSPWKVW